MENLTIVQSGIEESKEDGREFCFQAKLYDEEDGGFLRKLNLTIESFDRDDAEFILDGVIGDIVDEDYEGILVEWDTTLTDVH